jgi:flavin reductase (DIM6/NTAB) family NADH-FMN oxidoreductase RutF
VTIHDTHPFLDPESERDPARRFRGRLGGAVTLWTSGSDRDRAGLTVSSVIVAGGEPARILGLLDPDSDLAETLHTTGRAVVHLLGWRHRDLADAFAGVAPAPGGAFRLGDFEDGEWGPRLVDAPGWAAASLDSEQAVGWSSLVTCVIDDVHLGEDTAPLVHRRGHYLRPTD